MILVYGTLADAAVQRVLEEVLRLTDDVLFVEERHHKSVVADVSLGAASALQGQIEYAGIRVPLTTISGMYVRWSGLGSSGLDSCMELLANVLPGRVMNRPAGGMSNSSKGYQTWLIREFGFRTPRTLLSNDPEDVLEFVDECQGDVVYKSCGGIRSVVQRLEKADLARLSDVRKCPVQFQERITGIDLRVHVVGERSFAVEIENIGGEGVDYRYSSQTIWRAVALDPHLEEQCVLLTQSMGLEFSGIDFIRTSDGEHVCLEVNCAVSRPFRVRTREIA